MKLDIKNTQNFISETELNDFFDSNKETIRRSLQQVEEFQDSQGWMRTEQWANQTALQRIQAKADEIAHNADAFVLVGIGGSNQAARAVIKALKPANVEIIYAGNTLSAYETNQMLESLRGKEFYIDVIAKNFETLEPGASFRALRSVLEAKYGAQANNHIIVTGTIGSHLEYLAKQHGYDFFTFPTDVGGRYSVFSDVGLLPMAVAGIDIKKLICGAKQMEQELRTDHSVGNSAIRYALVRNLLYRKGYRMEMLSFFEPRLRYFAKWWIQLFAESEGKDSKGIYPIVGQYSEDLHSIGQFVQDGSKLIFETFIRLTANDKNIQVVLNADQIDDHFDYLNGKDFWDINKSAEQATITAHSATLPCLEIEIDAIDEYNLGQLFYFYMATCAVSGALLGVNPYNQDGVEAYKKQMFLILGK